jgi:ribosomal protein S18 acetylase RimI-like enzyme
MATQDPLPAGALDTDAVLVRNLRADDLDAMVRIDRAITGHARRGYYEIKMKEALAPGTMRISLAAEEDGRLAGFMLGSLYYGEFGLPEPSAVLDTIAVDPQLRGRRIGKALLRQLVTNLRALGIDKIRTEVEWDQFELMGFLASRGFAPARRLCLDLDLGDPAADPSR